MATNIVTLKDEDGNIAYPRTLVSAIYDSNGADIKLINDEVGITKINNMLGMADMFYSSLSLQQVIKNISVNILPNSATRNFNIRCLEGKFMCTLTRSENYIITGIAIPTTQLSSSKSYIISYNSNTNSYLEAEIKFGAVGIR